LSKVAQIGSRKGKTTRVALAVTINKTARRAVSAIKTRDGWTLGREDAGGESGIPPACFDWESLECKVDLFTGESCSRRFLMDWDPIEKIDGFSDRVALPGLSWKTCLLEIQQAGHWPVPPWRTVGQLSDSLWNNAESCGENQLAMIRF
jgi:hypothetical protein